MLYSLLSFPFCDKLVIGKYAHYGFRVLYCAVKYHIYGFLKRISFYLYKLVRVKVLFSLYELFSNIKVNLFSAYSYGAVSPINIGKAFRLIAYLLLQLAKGTVIRVLMCFKGPRRY